MAGHSLNISLWDSLRNGTSLFDAQVQQIKKFPKKRLVFFLIRIFRKFVQKSAVYFTGVLVLSVVCIFFVAPPIEDSENVPILKKGLEKHQLFLRNP